MRPVTARMARLLPRMPESFGAGDFGRLEVGQLLGEARLLQHEPLAVLGHHAMQLERLPHEIGDHGQEAHVVVDAHIHGAFPDALDGERARDLRVDADRDADEGLHEAGLDAAQALPAGEQRMQAAILNGERGCRGDDLVDGRHGNLSIVAARHVGIGRGGDVDFGVAFVVEQGQRRQPHVQERTHDRDDIIKHHLQTCGRCYNLGNLINAAQRGFAVPAGCGQDASSGRRRVCHRLSPPLNFDPQAFVWNRPVTQSMANVARERLNCRVYKIVTAMTCHASFVQTLHNENNALADGAHKMGTVYFLNNRTFGLHIAAMHLPHRGCLSDSAPPLTPALSPWERECGRSRC